MTESFPRAFPESQANGFEIDEPGIGTAIWRHTCIARVPMSGKCATVLTAVKDTSEARAASRRPMAVLDLRSARWHAMRQVGTKGWPLPIEQKDMD